MFLEIVDIPGADTYLAVLVFADVPWTLPIGDEPEPLRHRVLFAIDEWHRLYGREPKTRLVFEVADERRKALEELDARTHGWRAWGHDTNDRLLTDYLGVEAIANAHLPAPHGLRELTPLEQRAAGELQTMLADAERLRGRRMSYRASSATAKENLTRPALALGLMFDGDVLVPARPKSLTARA